MADPRLTQVAVEVLTRSNAAAVRPTQVAVEGLNLSNAAVVRPTQVAVEILVRGVNAALATQVAVEVILKESKGWSYGYIID